MSELIEIGRILRPKGLKGELKVELSGEERLHDLKAAGKVLFEKDGKREFLSILETSWHNGFGYILFAGYDTVESAEKLRDGVLLIEKEALPELAPGSYYPFMLNGLRVEFETGEVLGVVVEVVDYPSCDAIEVKTHDGRLITFPMTKSVLLSVDVAGGVIKVSRDAVTELLE